MPATKIMPARFVKIFQEGDVVVTPSGRRAVFLEFDAERLAVIRCTDNREVLHLPPSVLARWQKGRAAPVPVRLGVAGA